MTYDESAGELAQRRLVLMCSCGVGFDVRATLFSVFEEHRLPLFTNNVFDGILQSLGFELGTKRSTDSLLDNILLSEGAL